MCASTKATIALPAASRMPVYPPGAPGIGQQIFYGQAPQIIPPHAGFGYRPQLVPPMRSILVPNDASWSTRPASHGKERRRASSTGTATIACNATGLPPLLLLMRSWLFVPLL
ncbi:Polyadenylate-binding protein 2-like protein [Drosera capensis]